MNPIRTAMQELKAEVARMEGRMALIELLGEGVDIEKLIKERKDELARIEQQIIDAQTPAEKARVALSEAVATAKAEVQRAQVDIQVAKQDARRVISEARKEAEELKGAAAKRIVELNAANQKQLDTTRADIDAALSRLHAIKTEITQTQQQLDTVRGERDRLKSMLEKV